MDLNDITVKICSFCGKSAMLNEAIQHSFDCQLFELKPDESRLLTPEEFTSCAGDIPQSTDVEQASMPWIFGAELITRQDAKTASIKDAELRRAIETIGVCHEGELAQKDTECQQRVEAEQAAFKDMQNTAIQYKKAWQDAKVKCQERVEEIYHKITEKGVIGNYNATGKYLCDLTPLLQALKK